MNRRFFNLALIACALINAQVFTSCGDDKDEVEEPTVAAEEYIYVVNNGNWGGNDGSLTRFNLKDSAVTQDFFSRQNDGRRLGDLAQDLIVYGSKMYITVNGSSTIEITDLDAKSLKQIKTGSAPHSLAAYGNKVYVTCMNGYLARIDTATMEIDAQTRVGRNPEQLTVAKGKIYVTNTGGQDYNTETGYDKTVSVVDPATFTETRQILVVLNPRYIAADPSGGVYVVSAGNYGDVPNALQKIDATTDAVSTMSGINGSYVATLGTTLYAVDAPWGGAVKYYSYDTEAGRLLSDNFVGNEVIASNPQLNTDAVFEHVYITSSDYMNNGDIYVFDKSGKLLWTFETGLNPMKAVRIKK
ncbi:MAG: hypothetical protein LBS80_05340 [Tannerella sp.]|jgi:hypothetical protein|nr:hypothetical protein [Tannerella sp.]